MYSLFAGQECIAGFIVGASTRIRDAFRPRTKKCYQLLFRNFVAFCIHAKISIQCISLSVVLAFLEFLAWNQVSVHMVANNVSAIKANLVLYGLDHTFMDHPRIKYFIKSMKMSRPLSVTDRPIMSIKTLHSFISACSFIPFGKVYAAVFLIAHFGFLRISNVAPHSYKDFHPSRHLTPSDVTFSKKFMFLSIKWSKTNQFRDKVQVITLPGLRNSVLCPVKALKAAMALYNPSQSDHLFQFFSAGRWTVLIDSRIRKILSRLNLKLGFQSNKYTFYTFCRSGATLAYNLNASLQSIKNMAPGHQTVSGLTSKKINILAKRLLRLLLPLCKYFPTFTGPLRVLYYIHVIILYKYISMHTYLGLISCISQ